MEIGMKNKTGHRCACAMVEQLESRRMLSGEGQWALVDTITIPSKGGVATSDISLAYSTNYKLITSGSVKLGKFKSGATRGVDAEYGQLYASGEWATQSDRLRYYNWGIGISLDGQKPVNDTDWGAYNASHVYEKRVEGNGSSLKAKFFDDCYGDNSGSMTIAIYKELAVVSIEANDPDATETADDDAVDEGEFTVTRTGDLSQSIDVLYSLSGTATEDQGNGAGDYQHLYGHDDENGQFVRVLSIPAGEPSAKFSLKPIKNDESAEGEETVEITLLPPGYVSGEPPEYVLKESESSGPVLAKMTTLAASTQPTTAPTSAIITIRDGKVELGEGQADVIGDFVASIKPQKMVKHFVTPKSAEGQVVLSAADSEDFAERYEWEGGVAVENSPEKRAVNRDVAGRYDVKLLDKKNGNKVVYKVVVWVVWADADMKLPIATVEPNFQIKIEKGITYSLYAVPQYTVFNITPGSIAEKPGDAPDLQGHSQSKPPSCDEQGTYNAGADFSASALFKWDVSRRARTKLVNPSNLSFADDVFDNGLGRPLYQDAQTWPTNELVGNDDYHVQDEYNDPYSTPFLKAIASRDTVRAGLRNNDGNVGDTLEWKIQLSDFARLEIGDVWYRISDDADWRVTFKAKKVNEAAEGKDLDGDDLQTNDVWVDDGCNYAKNHEDW